MRLSDAIKSYVGVMIRSALQEKRLPEEMKKLAQAEKDLDEACSKVEISVNTEFKELSFQE